jgi:MFS transporter, AAHS family, 4-hydroxybenzoate transporter
LCCIQILNAKFLIHMVRPAPIRYIPTAPMSSRTELLQHAARTLDVAATIDSARVGLLQREVILLCFLISMLDGFDTQAIAFAAPALAARWHVPLSAFGPIFSASLLGSMFGVAIGGRLADRYGRRWLTIGTVALFAVATLACADADSVHSLIAYRFVAGLGLGGVIPNFMSLAAEFAPQRLRATVVAWTLWGFPLGAVAGGALSVALTARYGAAAVFILGGLTPLLLTPLLIARLPESIRWLLMSNGRQEQARRLLLRIAPTLRMEQNTVLVLHEPARPANALRAIFTGELAPRTFLFAGAMLMSLLLSYLLVTWIPLLLRQSGLNQGAAIAGTVVFNLAGIVGSVFFTRGVDQGSRPLRLMVWIFCMSAAAVASIGLVGTRLWAVMGSIFVAGFLLLGIQMTLSAFIVGNYPTALRATAIGWIQAAGRLGSLLGPLFAGLLLSLGTPLPWIFAICGLPALFAAGALAMLTRLTVSK